MVAVGCARATLILDTASTSHVTNALTKTPVVGPFVDMRETTKSGEDHQFRGLREKEEEGILARDSQRRHEQSKGVV